MQSPISDVRAFNRFYTGWIGALDRGHLGSDFSLTEVRVLYELVNRDAPRASDIAEDLHLDAGYLSRMVKRFERLGLAERAPIAGDGRATAISLTKAGHARFAELDRAASQQVASALMPLTEAQSDSLVTALSVARRLLDRDQGAPDTGVVLRAPRPGDYGWAIERHGAIYAAEFGWDERFEGLVAEVFGKFAQRHDPTRERCWIAEVDGRRAGCVFMVEREPEVAQLRCLLVDPAARGRGVGAALVEACLSFAREAGYRRMMLWTNSVLESARRIYEAHGFMLVDESQHRDFGPLLTGQSWEVEL